MLKRKRYERITMLNFKMNKKLSGVPVPKHKRATENKSIEQATIPKTLIFPMDMHIGKPAEIAVSVGEKVKIGTLLGKKSGLISANIHSSVSGEVRSIEDRQILGRISTVIVIENDFKDYRILSNNGVECTSREQFIEKIKAAGIVGLGGATFPTDVKLNAPDNKEFKHLIINVAECEPFVTADRRLIIEHLNEIINGIEMVASFLAIEDIHIALETNSALAIDQLEKKLVHYPKIKLKKLPNSYPQGAEKTLTKSVLGKEIPAGTLPIDIGTLVINASTIFSIYQSVLKDQPLIERVVTISGSPINQPKNLMVRIGTPVQSVIEDCGNFSQPPGKLLNGGPMMGRVIASLNEPITKGTSLVLALSQQEAQVTKATNCIKCSQCINVCPMNLQPILISQAYEKANLDEAEQLGALNCIDCGACSFICPSRIDILGNIKAAKNEIMARKRKELSK